MMTIKTLILLFQVCVLLLSPKKALGSNLRITYHVICDDDNLISVSYRLMDSETEIFSDSIDIGEDDGIDSSIVKSMCTNPHFRKEFSDYPLIPTLQHGYVTISLESPKQFPDQIGSLRQVSKYNHLSKMIFNLLYEYILWTKKRFNCYLD